MAGSDIKLYEIEYVDRRPLWFPMLMQYPRGIEFPNKKGNVIKVTEKEKQRLLKMRNGLQPVFVEKKTTKKSEEVS